MIATEKNEKIARQIINLLAENKLSFNEAIQIINYVKHELANKSTVQPVNEKLFEV